LALYKFVADVKCLFSQFRNASDSKTTVIKNLRQVSDFSPPVNLC